jgi:FkbM family methyltransferase
MRFEAFDLLTKLGRHVPDSVIQVGAHVAEEISAYRMYGVERAILIDPLDTSIYAIKCAVEHSPSYIPVQAVCSNKVGEEVTFHVSDNWGASSSILPPGNHLNLHPEVKFAEPIRLISTTVDKIVSDVSAEYGIKKPFEMLFMDCQGAELMVLQGATSALAGAKYIYTEVSQGGLYQGDVKFFDIMNFLNMWNFDLYDLNLNHKNYGDALFIKRGI